MTQQNNTLSNTGIFPNIRGDALFIIAIPAIAIFSGIFVSHFPHHFMLVLMLDLWLLGYHHVISTYTRIGFDTKSFREHWMLTLPLPVAVFCSVFLLYNFGGAIVIGSVYLYWQWYHYSRQSDGIAKSYGFKCTDKSFVCSPVNRLIFYMVPFTSFIYMVSDGPSHFLNIPIFTVTLPIEVRWTLLAVSFIASLYWLIIGTKALLEKQITGFYFTYMLSHFGIYLVAYTLLSDINYSWLTINIWHNAQYIGFVWLFNRKKYLAGIDRQHLFVSYISQPNRFFIYMGSCLLISLGIYWLVDQIINLSSGKHNIAMIFIVYSAINFHHYIVDSKIWKLRKHHIQKTITE